MLEEGVLCGFFDAGGKEAMVRRVDGELSTGREDELQRSLACSALRVEEMERR